MQEDKQNVICLSVNMDSDDSFTISKRRRPDEAKNRNRNASAEHLLAHLKGRYGVMKTYHMWEGAECWTNRHQEKMDRTVMRQDLTPFVMYSMNKRRNWEIDELNRIQLIGEMQKMHKGQDVYLMERVAFRTYYWPNTFRYCCQWEDFRLWAVHELNTYVSGRPSYEETRVNSVYGQHMPHFLKHNRCAHREDSETMRTKNIREREAEKRTAVAYHLIKPPENYLTLFQKQFVRKSNHPGRWNAPSFLERMRMSNIREFDVRYDDYSDCEGESEDADEEVLEQKPRNECYNWEDHFVEHFVRVKRKRKKGKR